MRLSLFRIIPWLWFIAALGLLGYGLHIALTVPADEAQGNVGRILYYHVPTWVAMFLFFSVNLICSIVYLLIGHKSPETALKADALAVSSAEMGIVSCSLGLITGSLWGRAVWGIWWTWDARLTATLVLLLIYISYLMVRKSTSGAQARILSSVLAIFAYCDIPIVYMSTRLWRTQHPGPVFFAGPESRVDPSLLPAINWNIVAWVVWGILVVGIRYRVERMRQTREQAYVQAALQA